MIATATSQGAVVCLRACVCAVMLGTASPHPAGVRPHHSCVAAWMLLAAHCQGFHKLDSRTTNPKGVLGMVELTVCVVFRATLPCVTLCFTHCVLAAGSTRRGWVTRTSAPSTGTSTDQAPLTTSGRRASSCTPLTLLEQEQQKLHSRSMVSSSGGDCKPPC